MTTLYKPVLIETAEQAEALPEGSFIIDALDLVARREKTGRYAGLWVTEEDGCLDGPVMPAQALVPIEAEEEWAIAADVMDRSAPLPTESAARAAAEDWRGGTAERRLVTPWESI